MRLLYKLSQISRSDRPLVGGKALALALMAKQKVPVPKAMCVSTGAYNAFMDETGLRAQVLMEYHRKDFDQMRWEEMWDCSLRIQNMFARAAIPLALRATMTESIDTSFGDRPVAVRSSAIGEDSASASFAGLHESYLNVRGGRDILEHIKLVWASTWSDAAILYRKEIGLDVENSSMAVVVQELVQGQESGVIFGKSPIDDSKAVVEAVHGLNQGLVDGTVEPDRWMIDRSSGEIVSHTPAQRTKIVVAASSGVKLVNLRAERRRVPPLTKRRVKALFGLEKRLAELFGSDQDVEWTYDHSRLCVLQSRPITASSRSEEGDDRKWYLSLRRSFDNLAELRAKIENEIIPGMVSEAQSLKQINLTLMPGEELADEISRRAKICERWKKQYWDFCIPFAHGMRLFGSVYNRTVKPDDPYQFLQLLAGAGLKSVNRNMRLLRLASRIKRDRSLLRQVQSGRIPESSDFSAEIAALVAELDTASFGVTDPSHAKKRVLEFISEMAKAGSTRKHLIGRTKSDLQQKFLSSTPKRERQFALKLIDLASASYRLRDDDNIYLGQLEKRLQDAVNEAVRRSPAFAEKALDITRVDEVTRSLRDPNYRPEGPKSKAAQPQAEHVRTRQLLGQPAGTGLAFGPARVVRNADDLFGFKKGEILVCDAIDPNMTFVVPLAAAIVERRGGMLVHGAIIAREYGLPCVTGVPDAVESINTGNQLTVDGYLGIVTISRSRR
jgi:pyruvate,water dikinase